MDQSRVQSEPLARRRHVGEPSAGGGGVQVPGGEPDDLEAVGGVVLKSSQLPLRHLGVGENVLQGQEGVDLVPPRTEDQMGHRFVP